MSTQENEQRRARIRELKSEFLSLAALVRALEESIEAMCDIANSGEFADRNRRHSEALAKMSDILGGKGGV